MFFFEFRIHKIQQNTWDIEGFRCFLHFYLVFGSRKFSGTQKQNTNVTFLVDPIHDFWKAHLVTVLQNITEFPPSKNHPNGRSQMRNCQVMVFYSYLPKNHGDFFKWKCCEFSRLHSFFSATFFGWFKKLLKTPLFLVEGDYRT